MGVSRKVLNDLSFCWSFASFTPGAAPFTRHPSRSVPLTASQKRASLLPQMAKNLPSMQVTWVWSLGQEDPLEKGMATHSSILAWRIPWTEDLAGYSPLVRKVGHD